MIAQMNHPGFSFIDNAELTGPDAHRRGLPGPALRLVSLVHAQE